MICEGYAVAGHSDDALGKVVGMADVVGVMDKEGTGFDDVEVVGFVVGFEAGEIFNVGFSDTIGFVGGIEALGEIDW